MWRCRKCNQQSSGTGRVCRACGGILEELPDEQPTGATAVEVDEFVAESPVDELPSGVEWMCRHCGEIVPGHFDVCWKCMTTKSGERHPDHESVAAELEPPEPEADLPDVVAGIVKGPDSHCLSERRVCRDCGSNKIMRNVEVANPGNEWHPVMAIVTGNPAALIFKDRMSGDIRADVCGECGQMELRVTNPQELYDHWCNSSEQQSARNSPLQPVMSAPCLNCGMLVVRGSATCPHCGTGSHSDA